MAYGGQNIGFGDEIVFAGDPARANVSITSGGDASDVIAAQWGIFALSPNETTSAQTALVLKTLGDGVSVADGASAGIVIASVVTDEGDTTGLAGDYYHEMTITTADGGYHSESGMIRLQKGAL